MTEAAVIAALAKRYPAPAWAFLPQVRNGTGYSRSPRTADAIAMGLWPSRGLELHGFEVKVSRSDWLREVKDPEKAEEISRYCHRWWVVVSDAAIVHGGELPPAWGLLAMRGGKLATITEAPRREAVPPDYPFLAAILRKAAEGTIPREAVELAVEERLKGAEERLRAAAEYDLKNVRRSLEKTQAMVAEFEAAAGFKLDAYRAGKQGAALRLILEGGLDGRRRQLERMASEMESAAARLREVLEEQALEAVQRVAP